MCKVKVVYITSSVLSVRLGRTVLMHRTWYLSIVYIGLACKINCAYLQITHLLMSTVNDVHLLKQKESSGVKDKLKNEEEHVDNMKTI